MGLSRSIPCCAAQPSKGSQMSTYMWFVDSLLGAAAGLETSAEKPAAWKCSMIADGTPSCPWCDLVVLKVQEKLRLIHTQLDKVWKPHLRWSPGGNHDDFPAQRLKVSNRPCLAKGTEETSTLSVPVRVVIEHPLPGFRNQRHKLGDPSVVDSGKHVHCKELSGYLEMRLHSFVICWFSLDTCNTGTQCYMTRIRFLKSGNPTCGCPIPW